MKVHRSASLCSALATLLLGLQAGCGSGNADPSPISGTNTHGATETTGETGDDTTSSTTATNATVTQSTTNVDGSGTATDTDTDTDTDTEGGVSCEELQCTGHGTCMERDGVGTCVCDPGYVLDDDQTTCIVDESCVVVRFLDERCRQTLSDQPPAVALFFGVDFCAGTAVTPQKLQDLGLEFLILENGIDIKENVESAASIIPREVESYVMLVVDMSDSVSQSQDLPALINALRDLVSTLDAQQGEVYVSVYVFGRFVAEYVPFTANLQTVDTALAAVADDPSVAVDLVGGMGTALYEAVEEGIENTQRIQELRAAVSNGGVLSTGTVIVVTDGDDTSNGMLNTDAIENTLTQVISIGISNDVDHQDLQAIGRDGSFLAPDPQDWATAFGEVTQRVEEYPQRSYLLGYCSSATQGTPQVEVSLQGPGLTTVTTAGCEFNAEYFTNDPQKVCNEDFFLGECDDVADPKTCGGLTACGACADDSCCGGNDCQLPITPDQANPPFSCDGQESLCWTADQVCSGDTCQDPATLGDACGAGCEPKVGWCNGGFCDAALTEGLQCGAPEQCESLSCGKFNPENPFDPTVCLTEARIHDACNTPAVQAICEVGAYCEGEDCVARKSAGESCSSNVECRSSLCVQVGNQSICDAGTACFWGWDEKVTG